MNSADLKFFRAVADANSICGAAGLLNTVQSNVTTRIKALEDEIGVPLFHRSRKGVTLTPVGDRLLPYARRIGDLLAEAALAVADNATPSGSLHIGSLETTAALRLPPILVGYAQQYPDVDVHITTGPTEDLFEKVLRRQLEGAFVSGPIDHPEIESTPVVDEELVIISSPRIRNWEQLHSDFGAAKLKVLAFRAGCSYRKRMEQFLTNEGLLDVRWMELGTLDGIVGCVSAGIGIAMLPLAVIEAALSARQVLAHKLPDNKGRATTVFIRRKNDYLSSALHCFIANAAQETPRPARPRLKVSVA